MVCGNIPELYTTMSKRWVDGDGEVVVMVMVWLYDGNRMVAVVAMVTVVMVMLVVMTLVIEMIILMVAWPCK